MNDDTNSFTIEIDDKKYVITDDKSVYHLLALLGAALILLLMMCVITTVALHTAFGTPYVVSWIMLFVLFGPYTLIKIIGESATSIVALVVAFSAAMYYAIHTNSVAIAAAAITLPIILGAWGAYCKRNIISKHEVTKEGGE